MKALIKLCQVTLLISLIFSVAGCQSNAKNQTDFTWLDIEAVPLCGPFQKFDRDATWRDLGEAYINLKAQCRVTNNGLKELQEAQRRLKEIK